MESIQQAATKTPIRRGRPQPVPVLADPAILLRPEAAAYLRFKSVRGFQHAIDRGSVPPGLMRFGRRVWLKADLEAWVAAGMPRPQAEAQAVAAG